MNWNRLSGLLGAAAGLAAVGLAMTPSLVPRPALFQGFLAGLSFSLAYLLAAWITRAVGVAVARRRGRSFADRLTWGTRGRVLAAVAALLYVAAIAVATIAWQNDVRAHVDMPPADGVNLATFTVVAVVVGAIVFAARRGLSVIAARTRRMVRRRSNRPGLAKASGLLAGALCAALALSLLVGGALLGTDRVYAARNATTPAGITEPASTFRSAGAASAVVWSQLGMQGRAFVGGGPTAAQISAVTHQPAKEPVRVYVGSAQEDSAESRAALAVAELKRTGGFARGSLIIATPTGSGWLERQAMDSVEYLHGGDTAIVSLQYSYQPSWVSFLFHEDLPRESGQALYQAVHKEWLAMPAAARPKLYVYGLSLGAAGMQSAFKDAADLTGSVDGAVFSGAPNNSQPWRSLQAARDAGSPVWQPVYDGGRHIRWLSKHGDFSRVPGPWEAGRVAYLQHGTDAVSWLTPTLIWQRPDWLGGSAAQGGRAPDVSDSMVWIPLVTYLQVAFDMFMGEAVPADHGHNFGDVAVEAWNNVAPSGLDQPAVDRIQAVIAAYPYEDAMTS